MHILCIGLNHKTAPLELREKVHIQETDNSAAVERIRRDENIHEALVLSTCNRTELYLVAIDPRQAHDMAAEFLKGRLDGSDAEAVPGALYKHKDSHAVSHLFKVAAGLDSLIVGEPQILGQVKEAYRLAVAAEGTGAVLNRLLHHSFRAGKRVRSDTGIGAGAVSVAYAAVELAEKVLGKLEGRQVVLLGAGDTGQLVARHLKERGVGSILVANRNRERGEALAAELGGQAHPFDERVSLVAGADLVVTAISSPEPILSRADLRRVMAERRNEPVVVIDLGVPRNVAGEAGKIENVFLFDVDSLDDVAAYNLNQRGKEVGKAEAIAAAETEQFLNWFRLLSVQPTIAALKKKLDKLGGDEIERVEKKFSAEDREKLEAFTAGLLKKILHHPMMTLRKAPDSPDGAAWVETTRLLFDLEGDEDE